MTSAGIPLAHGEMELDDWLTLLEDTGLAAYLYLAADHEWWLAHDPDGPEPDNLEGPFYLWTTYPSAGWEHDAVPDWLLRHHLDELYHNGDPGESSDIYRAQAVRLEDAPEFVREAVGGGST